MLATMGFPNTHRGTNRVKLPESQVCVMKGHDRHDTTKAKAIRPMSLIQHPDAHSTWAASGSHATSNDRDDWAAHERENMNGNTSYAAGVSYRAH